ncbi:MAG: acetylornithine transaminase, partial [Gammaproteobacteria bacterium]|nr:acetylornithine transaminase [Gammaproteobacteria bacterium]
KCAASNTELLNELRDQGLLLVKAGDNVLRLLPPLNVSATEEDEAIEILYRVASARVG